MDYYFFIKPFFLSLVISFAMLLVIIKGARFFKISDSRLSDRHIHKKGVLRLGGVAMIAAFVAVLFFDHRLVITNQLLGVLLACAVILFIGVYDDFKQLTWKSQLFLQIIVIAIVFLFGTHLAYISNPFGGVISFSGSVGYCIGIILAALWMIFIMNALNWVDGVDGLSGGITAIGAVTIFLLSLRPEVNQPPIAIVAITLLGVALSFLIFNFYPARIIAGTSGSMFMGFILGVIAIFAGAKIATTALVMVVPLMDAIWVMYERLRSGESLFLPDKRHLHFRLIQLGWNQWQICFLYYSITTLVAFLALNSGGVVKVFSFFVLTVVLFSSLMIISKKTNGI
jgi:UDP-GlcNAc:undecaprenyl-phosphate GlcNAc-1-phosphate transferase